MEFTKHQATMQQHTTTIVLSTHKSSITSPVTSPELDSAPILHSPSPPKESRGKHKERRHNNRERKEKKDQETKEKTGKKENSKKERQNRIYKLPKEVIKKVCDQLTFEEMFACAAVSKKMAKKFYRILTSHKKCSSIEKKDLRILLDPSALEAGITFYRVANNNNTNNNNNNNNNNNKYSILEKSYLQEIENKEKTLKREISKNILTNTVCHDNSGQVAYHLKQLEHMLIYNTVNGNEVVRVANNWIFFNRRLFIKINNTVSQSAPVEAEDDRLCLVDIVVVEANLCRKAKSSFFGRAATPAETFCQINLDNLHLRTSVTSQEVDPIWNEDSSFVVKKNTSYKLQISMLEYGKLGRHTLLGQVEISLKDLASNVVHDIWQPVQSTEENFSGNFHVMIHKSPVPKKEVDTRTLGMLGHFGAISTTVPLRLEEGDIVLISNSEFYTHIAKLGTLSVWDHVAMVVSRHGELHLFESTPDGVFTSPLDRRLKFYLQASTLGFRRLTIERTASMKKNLKSFIKEVDGRPYKQNWMDLVRAWQGSHTSEDLSSIFCSELVAAAYKRMGLLDNKISSNNFLPVDFALPNNNKVKLLQGRLEKIRMIYAYHSDD